MITKERLEELIKEKATIYKIRDSMIDDYQLCSCNYLENNELIYGNVLTNYCIRWIGKLEDLFETKEDAEFALKYQNITRTETLSLPTWEEISNRKEYSLSFCAKQSRYCLCIDMPYRKDEGCIVLVRQSDPANRTVMECEFERIPATKANYIEACELCRKLFLWEEEE